MERNTNDHAECVAEGRNRQALHAMEVDWGRRVVNYGKIRAILSGRRTEGCQMEHCVAESRAY